MIYSSNNKREKKKREYFITSWYKLLISSCRNSSSSRTCISGEWRDEMAWLQNAWSLIILGSYRE